MVKLSGGDARRDQLAAGAPRQLCDLTRSAMSFTSWGI
jgi:hypothetical protein